MEPVVGWRMSLRSKENLACETDKRQGWIQMWIKLKRNLRRRNEKMQLLWVNSRCELVVRR